MPASARDWLLPLGLVAGYALMLGTSPVRMSLRDGMRTLQRYRRVWLIPASLGFFYALSRAGLQWFIYSMLPENEQPAFGWQFTWQMPAWPVPWHLLWAAALQGAETVAGLCNNVVTTFPFSAVAAVMLLANWEGHHATLRQALRRRFGKKAWLAHAGILTCALAAVVKPALFGPSLLYLNRLAPGLVLLRWSALIDWLSFLFEYLFGVCVQIYLILLVYTWLRGLNWTSARLMDMAIRRFSFVVKWAAVVMVASSLLIDLPRTGALLFRFDDAAFLNQTFAYIDGVGRPLLALFLISFSTMQITLTFHSETLRKALAQHFHFIRRFWWQLLWFLLVAAIHLFAVALFNGWLLLGLGEATIGALAWNLAYPILAAFVAAWLLASWVSLFKRCETGRVQSPDWIGF